MSFILFYTNFFGLSGGLTSAKDDNEAAVLFIRRTLPIFNCVDYTTILKRRKDPISHLGGNNTATFVFAAADLVDYFLSTGSIPVFPIQVCIYATFIYIDNLFWRYILDLFLIRCYFFRLLLSVPRRLFLRVIFCRPKAYRMPLSLHPNVSAISDWYASGCSAT